MRWSFALGLLLLGACFVDSPTGIEDTVGVVARWECEGGACEVVPFSATAEPPSCGARDRWMVGAGGAIAILCATSDGEREPIVHEATCRPLACEDALDCPQWEDLVYGCDGGICTTDQFALDALDVRAVCLRHVLRAPTCEAAETDPRSIERTSIALDGCPSTRNCRIPDGCRP